MSFLRKKVPCKCCLACSVRSGNDNDFFQCPCRCEIDKLHPWKGKKFISCSHRESITRTTFHFNKNKLYFIASIKRCQSRDKTNIGSSFDDFLKEEVLLDEVTAVAVKRVIAWQIAEEMKAQNLTKSSMAKKMHTSRASLNRLLDATDTSLTLTTLSSAASVLGKKLRIELAPWIPSPRPRSTIVLSFLITPTNYIFFLKVCD